MIYTSTDFDREQSAAYTLLVRVGSDENALAIIGNDGQLKLITTYDPAAVEQNVTELLDLNFSAVKLSHPGSRYTFIPEEVFDHESKQLYIRHLPTDGLVDTAVSDIAPLGMKVLYQIDRLYAEPFIERFPDMLGFSTIQVLLQGIADEGLKTSASVLVIDKQASALMICFFRANRFVYANDFDLRGTDDDIYYLFSVSKHLGLEENRPKVYLSGDVLADDEIHRWSLDHGDEVIFADSGALLRLEMPAELVPQQHRFLTLLGLYVCG